MVDLLCGRPGIVFSKQLPFPHRFLVARTGEDAGAIVLKLLKDDVVKPHLEDYAAGALAEYLSFVSGEAKNYAVTFKKCQNVVNRWRSQHFDMETLPSAVSFKSDKGYCLARHDFDPADCTIDDLIEKAPTFAEMLSRLANGDAFCMRVGSIFDPAADRKQAIWMWGPVDCGKSQFQWLVETLAGAACTTLSSDVLESQFWKEGLMGKRVAVVQEATAAFIRHEKFKALTGDSTHPVNRKNRAVVVAKLEPLLFFFSNDEPKVPRDEAIMRRIIDCRIDPVPKGVVVAEAELRGRLRAELPHIVGYCMARYGTLQPGSRLPCSQDELEQTVQRNEADYLDFIDHYFEQAAGCHVSRSIFREKMVEFGFRSSIDQGICKRVLLSNYGVREVRMTFDTNEAGITKRAFVYDGIRLRNAAEKQFVEHDLARAGHVSLVWQKP